MPKAKITKSTVDAMTPTDARFVVWDTEMKGFGVRVSTEGRKTYVVQYRLGGRGSPCQQVKLGVHGQITADQARKLAQQALGEIAAGVDVAAEKRRRRRERRDAPTVEQCSTEFMDIHVRQKLKPTSARNYQLIFDTIVNPAIGKRLIKDLTFGDVEKLHHERRTTPFQANRTVAVLSKMMSWAIRAGYRPDRQNPCKGLERFRERRRQRFLSEVELSALGAAIRQAETEGVPWTIDSDKPTAKHLPKDAAERRTLLSPFAAAAIRLLVFTGARLREILTLKWAHVDLAAGVLRLPDSKTGEKTIALNPPSIAVLVGLPRLDGNPYVIPGDLPGSHRADLNSPWRAVRKLAGLDGVRIHDLRHTLASHGRAAGLSLSLVGGLLGHKNQSTTAGYAHLWDDPLREAANKVGARIASAFDGPAGDSAEVVAMRKSK
jgi:integrase